MKLYDMEFSSRLLLGTARYPSPAILCEAVRTSGTQIVTVSLRREAAGSRAGQQFYEMIGGLGVSILPNTAGCYSVREAVTTAHMARELFGTHWIKLEVIADEDTLCPDVHGLVEAAKILCAEGFAVFPYTTEDLSVADRLLAAGCKVLMPWGAPIGSGQGLRNAAGLLSMRNRFADVPLIVDAGIGRPSDAARAMELGMDAVLINTAIASAGSPPLMARAFKDALEAGARGFEAGAMTPRDMAVPSTPMLGKAAL